MSFSRFSYIAIYHTDQFEEKKEKKKLKILFTFTKNLLFFNATKFYPLWYNFEIIVIFNKNAKIL